MPKRPSKIVSTLKQLGEIQVTEWDFMALLNKDIREFELGRSLRRLGQIRVTDWDFRDVVPAVKKVANREVDVLDLLKRTANYKVMEWDFKSPKAVTVAAVVVAAAEIPVVDERAVVVTRQSDMVEISRHLREFLEYVVENLADEPGRAEIRVVPLKPTGLCFEVILTKRDFVSLIGKGGQTVTAIRRLLKAAAQGYGVAALLQIRAAEEESRRLAEGESTR